jgi:hypothetical protein
MIKLPKTMEILPRYRIKELKFSNLAMILKGSTPFSGANMDKTPVPQPQRGV